MDLDERSAARLPTSGMFPVLTPPSAKGGPVGAPTTTKKRAAAARASSSKHAVKAQQIYGTQQEKLLSKGGHKPKPKPAKPHPGAHPGNKRKKNRNSGGRGPAVPFTFDIEYSVPPEDDGSLLDGPEDYFDSYARLGSSRRSSRQSSSRSRSLSFEPLQMHLTNNNNNQHSGHNNSRNPSDSEVGSMSMPSLREEGSTAESTTIQSILFRETPGLPKLDAHVRRDSLKFQNLAAKLRQERIIATPSGRVRTLSNLRPRKSASSLRVMPAVKEQQRSASRTSITLSDHGSITVPSLPNLPQVVPSHVRFAGVEQLRRELKKMEHDRKQLKKFDQDDIEKAIMYVDSFGDGDGMISLEEFEHAFKRSRRAIATQSEELQGRKLMKRLQYLLDQLNMDVPTWFRTMDTSYRRGEKRGEVTGDGLISTLELKQGLTRMASALVQGKGRRRRRKNGAINPYEFSTRDIVCLLRYMDPNGDGDLSLEEVEDAFERAQAPPEALKVQMECGQVLKELWDQMQIHGLRVMDLFNMIDLDGSGYINSSELALGMEKLSQKPAQERALEARLRELEERDKLNKHRKEAKRAEAERKVKESIADGSFQLIQGLYSYMKRRQMRLKDLFTKAGVDKSGDGSLDAGELLDIMKMFRIKCTKRQANNLISKLDEGGNGSIEMDELEEAIKSHRKHVGVLKKEGVALAELLKDAGLPVLSASVDSSLGRMDSFGSISSIESFTVAPKQRKRTDAEIGKNLQMFKALVQKHIPALVRQGKPGLQRSSSNLEDALANMMVNDETESLADSIVSTEDKSLASVVSSVVYKNRSKARRKLKQKSMLPPALPGSELDTSWLVSWDSRMEKNVRRLGCV